MVHRRKKRFIVRKMRPDYGIFDRKTGELLRVEGNRKYALYKADEWNKWKR